MKVREYYRPTNVRTARAQERNMYEPIPKPEKRVKVPKPLKRSRLKQGMGKRATKWAEYRTQWFIDHPPDYKGNYSCDICGQFVHKDEVTLDHVIPRSRRPDLVFTDSNIVPAHFSCNSQKGSKTA